MPQYDVYANPSRSAADGIPYVVVIQSDLLDALPTRLAMPLALPVDGDERAQRSRRFAKSAVQQRQWQREPRW